MASDSANLIALPPGFRLGEYRIERYLGSGGFGITYAAIDENLNRRVAIKEYLPKALAMRDDDARVTFATAEDEDDFRWGLDRFLDEARALARFDHPNIVSVERFIEAHGTGYIVMEHVDGESLSELLRRKPTLTEAEIRENVLPVAAGLDEVHRAGLLHRDIKPSNIVVRANGVPVLIDFGSARHEASAKSRSLTAVITPGYAPLEQYSSSLGDERPATDIYALGAVLYRCVTGDSPPDATDRALEDRLPPAAEAADGIYSPGLLAAIDAALRMRADERPRDIAAFLQLMSTGDIRSDRSEDNREKAAQSSWWEIGVLGVMIAVIVGGLLFAVFRDLSGGEGPAPAVTSERPSLGEPPRSALPVAQPESLDPPPLSSFTVEVEPPHARVRVMNIAPVYEPGIMLAAGSYTVEVSASGYETVTEVVQHDVKPLVGADRLGYTPTVHRVELQHSFGELGINGTTKGRLESGDIEIDGGRFADLWRVQVPAGRAGQTLIVEMISSDFDAVLTLSSAQDLEFMGADGADDDCGISIVPLSALRDRYGPVFERLSDEDLARRVYSFYEGFCDRETFDRQFFSPPPTGELSRREIDTAAHASVDLPQQGGEYFAVATSHAVGEVGAYELRVDVSSPAPTGRSYRYPPSSSPAEREEGGSFRSETFTRGSHEDEVRRLQGTPTEINAYPELGFERWGYGRSSVEISTSSRRVTEWSNTSGNLKVQMEPGPNTTRSIAFTRGSHEDDVLRLQGTPTEINAYPALGFERWSYGRSSVEISTSSRRVTEWSNTSGILKVRMEPGSNITRSVAFTRGSHEDDVLRLQGTPTEINVYSELGFERWGYGRSSVEISTSSRRVTEWSNTSGNLKVR